MAALFIVFNIDQDLTYTFIKCRYWMHENRKVYLFFHRWKRLFFSPSWTAWFGFAHCNKKMFYGCRASGMGTKTSALISLWGKEGKREVCGSLLSSEFKERPAFEARHNRSLYNIKYLGYMTEFMRLPHYVIPTNRFTFKHTSQVNCNHPPVTWNFLETRHCFSINNSQKRKLVTSFESGKPLREQQCY